MQKLMSCNPAFLRSCNFLHSYILFPLQKCISTGITKRGLPRLRECSIEVEEEAVSNSSDKIRQTWEAHFWGPLYFSHGLPALLTSNTSLVKKCKIGLFYVGCSWPKWPTTQSWSPIGPSSDLDDQADTRMFRPPSSPSPLIFSRSLRSNCHSKFPTGWQSDRA